MGQKRARIPPIWQLQKYVEFADDNVGRLSEGRVAAAGGDGFFLRTDVQPGSTVLDLRREIVKHPRVRGRALECVKMSLEGRLLDDDETVRSLNLFNRLRGLVAVVDRTKPMFK